MVIQEAPVGSALPISLGGRQKPSTTDAEVLRRLLTRGAKRLSEAELLTLILGPGEFDRAGLTCAHEVLTSCGGLAGLLTFDLATARAQALDDTQAAALLAAVELSRRLVAPTEGGDQLQDPAFAARFLYLRFARSHQEILGAVFLDDFHRPLSALEFFRGLRRKVVVGPQPILREALRRNASNVLLFHTHPSGDPTPSVEDWKMTERARLACEVLGIELVDHLVLGGDRWISLRRTKPW